MNLIMVRHGESEGNRDKSVYFKMPDWSIPLTEKGKQQAELVSDTIANLVGDNDPMIISSPYVRAMDTAKSISNKFIFSSIRQNVLIREREWGGLREEYVLFKTRKEREHLFDFYRRPHNGESLADCYQRAFIFLNWLSQKNKSVDYSVIVSHGEFIRLLIMIIDNIEMENFDKLSIIKNCEVVTRTI